MKTHSVKEADVDKKWFIVDAANQPLGRLASQIAYVLRGKHKATFTPHLDCGDNVIVINASELTLTGRKMDQKFYYRHSNYIGGIKAVSAKQQHQDHPDRMVTAAVKGMLPRNKLGKRMLKSLKVFNGAEHSHGSQKPEAMPVRTLGGK